MEARVSATRYDVIFAVVQRGGVLRKMMPDCLPVDDGPELASKVQAECFKKGLIVLKIGHFGNRIRFVPPLTISRELINKSLSIFTEAVKETESNPPAKATEHTMG